MASAAKALLEERKRKLAEGGNPKYRRRGDIEREEAEKLAASLPPSTTPAAPVTGPVAPSSAVASSATSTVSATTTSLPTPVPAAPGPSLPADKEREKDKDKEQARLPRKEVIRRLRQRKQVVTFFGESDQQRAERLHKMELDDPEGEKHEGQENDYYAELKQLKEQEQSMTQEEIDRKVREAQKNEVEFHAPASITCDEDWIATKLCTCLAEWSEVMDARSTAAKRSGEGKGETAKYNQTRSYLKPLLVALNNRTCEADVVAGLKAIFECLEQREYLKANDVYLRLAIGNAPWPMGVTMVGIHERSGREKISSGNVAHILNDETSRKYMQMIKRVMTFLQRQYPAVPSKCIG